MPNLGMDVEKLGLVGKNVTRSALFILEKTGQRREAQRQRKWESAGLKRYSENHGATVIREYPSGALHLITTAGQTKLLLLFRSYHKTQTCLCSQEDQGRGCSPWLTPRQMDQASQYCHLRVCYTLENISNYIPFHNTHLIRIKGLINFFAWTSQSKIFTSYTHNIVNGEKEN